MGLQAPTLAAARSKDTTSTASTTSKKTGLVACSQTYDSVTKVIGPLGDTLQVGHHILVVHALALTDTVSITAVAPADTVRWVRFHPDGLVFQPTADGWSALLYTNYKDCGVPTTQTVRLAQVSDSLAIEGYLPTYVQSRKNPWSQANQYVIGLLQHFSNYAVAW
ncbi:MAG: hypothetical protein AUH68_00360 [Gemmatimonadetes bacterium 13_1_40CM_4_69_5]|nr:MAG: hypothetical protein AUH68_00360 [Gemmatimonadetes bacterium 13_1_40CM_4_69_5]